MKLYVPELSEPLHIDEKRIASLVVEAPCVFTSIVSDIYAQSIGKDGKCILSENDEPISILKNVELVTSFIPFELNKKALLNKIITALEKTAESPEFFMQTSDVLAKVENYVSDITFEHNCEFECEKLSASSLFKAVGLRIYDEVELSLMKVFNYMELVREYDKDKLFVFVNMRSYFPYKELQAFANTVIDHKYNVLLIDSLEYERLNKEERVIIDTDICEIR